MPLESFPGICSDDAVHGKPCIPVNICRPLEASDSVLSGFFSVHAINVNLMPCIVYGVSLSGRHKALGRRQNSLRGIPEVFSHFRLELRPRPVRTISGVIDVWGRAMLGGDIPVTEQMIHWYIVFGHNPCRQLCAGFLRLLCKEPSSSDRVRRALDSDRVGVPGFRMSVGESGRCSNVPELVCHFRCLIASSVLAHIKMTSIAAAIEVRVLTVHAQIVDGKIFVTVRVMCRYLRSVLGNPVDYCRSFHFFHLLFCVVLRQVVLFDNGHDGRRVSRIGAVSPAPDTLDQRVRVFRAQQVAVLISTANAVPCVAHKLAIICKPVKIGIIHSENVSDICLLPVVPFRRYFAVGLTVPVFRLPRIVEQFFLHADHIISADLRQVCGSVAGLLTCLRDQNRREIAIFVRGSLRVPCNEIDPFFLCHAFLRIQKKRRALSSPPVL